MRLNPEAVAKKCITKIQHSAPPWSQLVLTQHLSLQWDIVYSPSLSLHSILVHTLPIHLPVRLQTETTQAHRHTDACNTHETQLKLPSKCQLQNTQTSKQHIRNVNNSCLPTSSEQKAGTVNDYKHETLTTMNMQQSLMPTTRILPKNNMCK